MVWHLGLTELHFIVIQLSDCNDLQLSDYDDHVVQTIIIWLMVDVYCL